MSLANNLVLEGREKEVYQKNLVEGLGKINRRENSSYLDNLIGLFSIYKDYETKGFNIFKNITVNKTSGFPNKQELDLLVREQKRRFYNKNNKNILYSSCAKFEEPHFVISQFKEQPIEFFINIKHGDNLRKLLYFFDYPDEKKVNPYKKDFEFYFYITHNHSCKRIKHTFDVSEDRINQIPRYITTLFEYCLEKKIVPNCLEKVEYSYLDSKSNIDEKYPQLNLVLKKSPGSYILKQRIEILGISRMMGFGKLGKRVEKKFYEKEVYACSDKIYNDIFGLFALDDSIEVI